MRVYGIVSPMARQLALELKKRKQNSKRRKYDVAQPTRRSSRPLSLDIAGFVLVFLRPVERDLLLQLARAWRHAPWAAGRAFRVPIQHLTALNPNMVARCVIECGNLTVGSMLRRSLSHFRQAREQVQLVIENATFPLHFDSTLPLSYVLLRNCRADLNMLPSTVQAVRMQGGFVRPSARLANQSWGLRLVAAENSAQALVHLHRSLRSQEFGPLIAELVDLCGNDVDLLELNTFADHVTDFTSVFCEGVWDTYWEEEASNCLANFANLSVFRLVLHKTTSLCDKLIFRAIKDVTQLHLFQKSLSYDLLQLPWHEHLAELWLYGVPMSNDQLRWIATVKSLRELRLVRNYTFAEPGLDWTELENTQVTSLVVEQVHLPGDIEVVLGRCCPKLTTLTCDKC